MHSTKFQISFQLVDNRAQRILILKFLRTEFGVRFSFSESRRKNNPGLSRSFLLFSYLKAVWWSLLTPYTPPFPTFGSGTLPQSVPDLNCLASRTIQRPHIHTSLDAKISFHPPDGGSLSEDLLLNRGEKNGSYSKCLSSQDIQTLQALLSGKWKLQSISLYLLNVSCYHRSGAFIIKMATA